MQGRNPSALTLTNQNEARFLQAEEQCHKKGTELQSMSICVVVHYVLISKTIAVINIKICTSNDSHA